MKIHKSFTLIELLVTIAIIAILASMLLPSLQKAKQKAQQTLCASQLKQVGYLILNYANDYSGYAPAVKESASASPSYVWGQVLDLRCGFVQNRNIFVCTSWSPFRYTDPTSNGYFYTYGMKPKDGFAYTGKYFNIFRTENEEGYFSPSNFFLLADSYKTSDPNQTQCNVFFITATHDNKIHLRHAKQANMWFADGSVRGVRREGMTDYGVTDLGQASY